MFFRYNDYELLYLIQDGEEKALRLLLKKYDNLIYTTVKEQYPYGDKALDLMQEGRMILYKCIYRYSRKKEVSFYSYFYICLKRMLNRELEGKYFKRLLVLRDSGENIGLDLGKTYVLEKLYLETFKDDRLAMLIYDECIIRHMSLRTLALKYNYSYTKVSRKWKYIVFELKKYVDYL